MAETFSCIQKIHDKTELIKNQQIPMFNPQNMFLLRNISLKKIKYIFSANTSN